MDMKLTDGIERFLDHCRTAKTLSTHTIRAYTADLNHGISRLGSERLTNEIDRDLLRQYIGDMLHKERLKESSVKRRLTTIKQFFKWLEREELIDISPFHRLDVSIRLPRCLPRALAVEDIRKLLVRAQCEALERKTHSSNLMHFIIVVLFVSGLRIGELTGVHLYDVQEGEGIILVRGKGNRERRIYLSGPDARELLSQYLRTRKQIKSDAELLLISSEGTPITPQQVRRRLATLAKRASITRHVTPHMLRHTAATQLIEAGVDIRFVQKLLGHASIATTQIYTQVSDSSLRATLEQADTLGRIRRK